MLANSLISKGVGSLLGKGVFNWAAYIFELVFLLTVVGASLVGNNYALGIGTDDQVGVVRDNNYLSLFLFVFDET